ncbi:MAG: glycosyltransferase, partial [Bdellovibrionota bacterium]
ACVYSIVVSMFEAQLASLPALGTASGGTPEVVVTGKTGWLFEPRSTESCQSAIEQALQERDRWEHYGSAAETTVRNDYDFDRILPETILVYRSLLD